MKVTICIGSACHVKGAPQVVSQFQQRIADLQLKDKIELGGKFCMGKCQSGAKGVSVTVDGDYFDVMPEEADSFFDREIASRVK